MAGFKIRTVTLHIESNASMEDVTSIAMKMLEARDITGSNTGIEVESVRITFPDPESMEKVRERIRGVEDLGGEDLIISIGNIKSSTSWLEEAIVELAREGLYAGIILEEASWEEAKRVSKLLHIMSEEDPSLATHIGVNTLGIPIVTPYYPLSHSPGAGRIATVALTYPNYLKDEYLRNGINGIRRAVLEAGSTALNVLDGIAKLVDAEAAGVDLSIAPWMEESTLGLVELVAGTRMPKPGFALGLQVLNSILAGQASKTRSIGFNEVQLPVAEDLKMKARVSEGETTASTLARLSGACLAGLDLVVVPASIEDVAGLILEVAAYSRSKGKVLGARIIPVEGVEPGDKVYLEKFGETPVIPISP